MQSSVTPRRRQVFATLAIALAVPIALAGPAGASGAWTISPTPALASGGLLGAMSCFDRTHCVAVGRSGSNSPTSTLMETWSGGKWRVMPIPSRGPIGSELSGVSCISATNCVAVGDSGSGGAYSPLILTLSGGQWSVAPMPPSSSGVLLAVSCPTTTFCVAVGLGSNGTLVETLSGGAWSVTPSPNAVSGGNGLWAVSCNSSVHCVAVGNSRPSTGSNQTLIETLSGGSWSLTGAPSPPNSNLNGVSCVDDTRCVAVGEADSTSPTPLVETSTGAAWSVSVTPNLAPTAILNGVSCLTRWYCVAVGAALNPATSNPPAGAIATFSQGTWSMTTSPNLGNTYSTLAGVSCSRAGHCAAAGSYVTGPSTLQTVVEKL